MIDGVVRRIDILKGFAIQSNVQWAISNWPDNRGSFIVESKVVVAMILIGAG
jgi:hypothetical protein